MSKPTVKERDHHVNFVLLCALLAILIWSGIRPVDRFTWFLEVAPIAIGLAFLGASYKRFRFTRLSYWAIFLAGAFMCIGGHYTYSQVPIGNWAKDAFHLSRNHWDRLGHFMQGVFTGLLMREIVLRRSGLKRGHWLFLLVSFTSLAIAAQFEFVEWAIAVFIGDGTQAYLATQGDEWDAHWDMLLAFFGTMLVQALAGQIQDRQLRKRGLALDR